MPEEVVLIVMSGMIMVTALGFGLMRTISRHLERKDTKSGAQHALETQLDDVKGQLEGVADLRAQVADIEERLDFTERVLARRGDGGRLPPSSE